MTIRGPADANMAPSFRHINVSWPHGATLARGLRERWWHRLVERRYQALRCTKKNFFLELVFQWSFCKIIFFKMTRIWILSASSAQWQRGGWGKEVISPPWQLMLLSHSVVCVMSMVMVSWAFGLLAMLDRWEYSQRFLYGSRLTSTYPMLHTLSLFSKGQPGIHAIKT